MSGSRTDVDRRPGLVICAWAAGPVLSYNSLLRQLVLRAIGIGGHYLSGFRAALFVAEK